VQEDPVARAEQTAEDLQPDGVETPLSPEASRPANYWGIYYGRLADNAFRDLRNARRRLFKARKGLRKSQQTLRKTEEEQRNSEPARLHPEEMLRTFVARRRQKGDSDAEIADLLGCTVQELQQRYPPQT
jgi:hypothetical protein